MQKHLEKLRISRTVNTFTFNVWRFVLSPEAAPFSSVKVLAKVASAGEQSETGEEKIGKILKNILYNYAV